MNAAYLLDRHADARPGAPAIVGPGGCTWDVLRDRVRRLAGGLAARGVGPGERVAILSANDPRYFEIYLALAWLGTLAVPLNTRLSAAELAWQLKDAGPRLWLVAEPLAALAEATGAHLPRVTMAAEPGQRDDYAALLDAPPAGDPAALAPDHLLGIFYTGGTTGLPRGVMLTHGNLLANAAHMVATMGFTGSDVQLHVAPMFHLADLGYLWAMMLVGAAHTFLGAWSPGGFAEAVARTQATMTLLAPSMLTMLVRSPDLEPESLASLRTLAYGGSPITEATLRRAIELLPGRLWQGYGQTEATHTVCLMTPMDHAATTGRPERLRSCGRPITGVDARVAGARLAPVHPGEPGEILMRGPTVMKGYWNRPGETAEALADGWLHTGDVATVDSEGYIYLLDRKKDMIITGGENVFSAEVEQALASHPAVLEAAVIAVPDETWGEHVHAVVVLAPDRAATPEELQRHCRRIIGGYKVPRSFEFREVLPRTPTGKVQKALLREPYWRGQPREIH